MLALAQAQGPQNQEKRPARVGAGTTGVGQKDVLADEVIRVLRENPPLMIEAKSQITAELARRGFPIQADELTDARIFAQIRENPDFRDMVANALKARGFLENEEPPTGSPEEQSEENAEGMNPTGDAPSVSKPRVTTKKPDRVRGRKDQEPETGLPLKARANPYKDIPALADLYRQFGVSSSVPQRFGAELFKNTSGLASNASSMDKPLGSDYVLGPGDGITVDLHGTYSQRLTRTVDHEGRISLPEIGNVLVAGSTISAAQENLQKVMKRQFREVTVDLSVNRLRRVRIFVVGDVVNPGAYDISSLSSVLTALLAAGGPSPVGSLRTMFHMRNGKRLNVIDLYDLMLHGVQNSEVSLQSGDSLLVPPVRPQVTVVGMVRRPAIYELNQEQTLQEVLELAGGVTVTGELSNIKVERIQAHSRREMLNLNVDGKSALSQQAAHFVLQDGDIVSISPILPYSDRVVYLQGHVFKPGKYPYLEGMTLADLIPSFQQLLPEPADKAEIIRLRAPDFRPIVLPVNLRSVLEGQEAAVKLQPFDTVRVLGRYENDAPTVSVYGEVMRPGEYPLSSSMTASDLVKMAGGFKRSAYVKSADLSSYVLNGERVDLDHREVEIAKAMDGEQDADVALKPGDVLTIRQLGQWSEIGGSINVRGAVLYPGRYGIQQGERLSAILRRAGGFLIDAYPAGAVLERVQVREIANKSREQLIQRLESQGADLSKEPTETRAAVGQQRQQLIERLKSTTASGRLVIRIQPEMSAWENTAADIEVRPGDTLYIPKRPNFVLVDGQVYSPSAITFTPGRNAGWYLRQAGGPTEFANRKDIFIIRANGSVIGRDSGSWWSGGVLSMKLNAGDTVVVPEKVASSSAFWRELAQSAQVVSAVAIAARVATSF